MARIAGLLHLASGAAGVNISEESVLAAWTIGDYFIPHTKAAYGLMADGPEVAAAGRIWRWARRRGLVSFTRRDSYRDLGLTPDEASNGVAVLIERGYLLPVPRERKATGPAPSPEYLVRPDTVPEHGGPAYVVAAHA